MVIRPAPTFLFPFQFMIAPGPNSAPSWVSVAFGLNFAHGDYAFQRCRSFTWAKTASGGTRGAAMVADREIRN